MLIMCSPAELRDALPVVVKPHRMWTRILLVEIELAIDNTNRRRVA